MYTLSAVIAMMMANHLERPGGFDMWVSICNIH